LDEIRRRVKEGSLQDLLAARTLLESAGKEYGWSTELVEMRERIQKVLWDREHANREGARFLLGLAAGLGLLLVAIVGFALWMTNRDTTETYFPNAGRPPFVGDVLKNPKDALHYVWVPPGTLTVGCLGSDTGCQGDESPRPLKRFDRGFWIGQTEVTDRAFDHLMQRGSSLDVWSIPSPARFVTWSEAQEFCKRAGAVLPSREQLEYAARGGASTVRYGELDTIAWYSGNAERQVHPVGKKQPNAYRLYDVLGNVWEWTATQSPAGFYVLFGGSFDSPPDLVRVSSQFRVEPQRRAGDIGFRCVLTPETNTP
jgi:formylglycine-generating enzyme required for sulfatase activity